MGGVSVPPRFAIGTSSTERSARQGLTLRAASLCASSLCVPLPGRPDAAARRTMFFLCPASCSCHADHVSGWLGVAGTWVVFLSRALLPYFLYLSAADLRPDLQPRAN